jgi:gamma-glutamylcyclotransferase (GGCT)/AIG2-like uncharacterized protein YtfP
MNDTIPSDEEMKLPFFVYGTLKPGEIAFHQIKDLIETYKEAELISYALYIRDGIPVIFENPNWYPVKGYLIWPKPNQYEIAKTLMDKYEGDRLYELKQVDAMTEQGSIECLTYIGKHQAGSHPLESGALWFSKDDPIFSKSFPSLFSNIKELSNQEINSGPEIEHWVNYNNLTSNYLLLVTIVERLAYLYCGELFEDRIVKRITTLGKCQEYLEAFEECRINQGLFHVEVFDSRSAGGKLNSKKSSNSLEAWYQVRSNLQHRGKDARRDVLIIKNSLVSLANIMSILLPKLLPGIQDSTTYKELVAGELIKLK